MAGAAAIAGTRLSADCGSGRCAGCCAAGAGGGTRTWRPALEPYRRGGGQGDLRTTEGEAGRGPYSEALELFPRTCLIAAVIGGTHGQSGQPTISLGVTGDVVRRLERALRRTPNLGLTVDGAFSAQVEAAVKQFQEGAGLAVDGGGSGPLTWAALPDGAPMPVLQPGSTLAGRIQFADTAHQWCDRAVEHDAARDRRDLRGAHQSLGRGFPGLGRRQH